MRFATRYMVENWWFELVLPRFGLTALAARGRTRRWRRMAANFFVLASDLGGLMIKVGQFLSSRLDVLPPEVTKELEGLQDAVAPEDFRDVRALAERELGMPLERAYAAFDPEPLAAASLGQAHRARLVPNGADDAGFADVVVKVQRPGIERIVDVDLAALRLVARRLNRVKLVNRRVDLPALAEEFADTSLEEVDYLHEAASAERFAAQFADDDRVRAPGVAWERATRRVLTLEDVSAIKINDLDALRAAGIDPAEVAVEFANVMFDQLFVHGFFHGDAHPGNIFVTPTPGGDRAWVLTFVDFGMMGEIPDGLRRDLQQFLIAVASRDGRRLVAAMRDLGVLLPSADTRELERTMSALFARFGGVAFTDLQDVDPRELRAFANEFGDTIRTLPFQLPEHFLLVIRAVSLISGLSSTLDPRFNIWNAVEPYADQLLRDESGGVVASFVDEAARTLAVAARLPRRLDGLVTRLEDGEVAVETPRLDRQIRLLERAVGRMTSALLFFGLLLGGVLLRSTDAVLGTVLMGVSGLPLLHAVVSGLLAGRSRR
ncbi:ABC1 kinase family protein [Amnibacterium setariae]|uniref:AarF/ABC1/UbiB kinase family protein n=1 Tax=Amnibacterium setariae TaxID=2306585 RepID=A0A3A1TYE1_9MICO|nr:AarF/UbiB family protein [Amnibacterium setariae]RIX28819.1 AarF/ABC1/UbiB kinase family protein [Amnibacterium setariae]